MTEQQPSADFEGQTVDPAELDEPSGTSRLRQIVGIGFIALIIAAVTWTIVKERHSFVATLHSVGVGGMLFSLLFGVMGVGTAWLQWRRVLVGLEVKIDARESARLFFLSQLGKYLPGSVWPVAMQVEAGRRWGVSRKSMIAAYLITLVLSVATGLAVAAVLLPFSVPAALHRFWWALVALPLIVVLALPKSLPYLLDLLLTVFRRKPLGVRLDAADTLWASGWAVFSWVGFGLHVAVLAAAVGHPSFGLVVLCIGGMALAVPAGVLFLPAPAGAGMRELVLGYVLVTVISPGQALAVVVASRVLLIVVDLILAAGAVLVAGRRPRAMETIS